MDVQFETDLCIRKFRSQYQRLKPEIEKHGLPIRMFRSQGSFLWRFDDGYELMISENEFDL